MFRVLIIFLWNCVFWYINLSQFSKIYQKKKPSSNRFDKLRYAQSTPVIRIHNKLWFIITLIFSPLLHPSVYPWIWNFSVHSTTRSIYETSEPSKSLHQHPYLAVSHTSFNPGLELEIPRSTSQHIAINQPHLTEDNPVSSLGIRTLAAGSTRRTVRSIWMDSRCLQTRAERMRQT